ncbi:ATP-binding protein [Oceaniserpentilla sp. 4NH20-0058]|uniref:AAA family ATPase n=1 Tax=Oceaniserpentilla sp. 4NH20-0058 TaxID=3127660 RepID=UPI0031073C90
MIHLVCGPMGAGKTTYAKQLAKEQNAICFSEDEWLAKLFVPDAPEGLLQQPMQVVGAWAAEKYLRCRGQIWLVCQQLLENNINIVLDGAAANKEQRDLIRQKAKDSNVEFKLHYVTSSMEVRHKRVFQRNKEQGETYSLEVTPAMFEHTEQFFEPPVGNELNEVKIIET